MGAPPYAQPMLVTSTRTITVLHYTYGCATLTEAYLCKIYLENHWVTLHLWVSNVKCSLFCLAFFQNQWVTLHLWVSSLNYSRYLLGLLTESLSYNTVMGAPP